MSRVHGNSGIRESRVWEELGEHRFMGFGEFSLDLWDFGNSGGVRRSWDRPDFWDFGNSGWGVRRSWDHLDSWDATSGGGGLGEAPAPPFPPPRTLEFGNVLEQLRPQLIWDRPSSVGIWNEGN